MPEHIPCLKELISQDCIRKKINGFHLNQEEIDAIVGDLVTRQLCDIYIAAFITACANNRLSRDEILFLTKSMIKTGAHLNWSEPLVVDKHCVGGLPGNRTTPIVVAIVTAFGLTMPKTSSRSITSPAGTADTMEIFAPVELDLETIHQVVNKEQGCIIWGGSVQLSPADDLFIRIEKTLDLDSEGQLIASVLSKKIAAGSNHIIIDIPIGPTAKVKDIDTANKFKDDFMAISRALGVTLRIFFSDGNQPVGRGIGPALEAKDVLSVLRCDSNAPEELRERALTLAGYILEFSPNVIQGTGKLLATKILNDGRALRKFEAICQAQGGMPNGIAQFTIPKAPYTYTIVANKSGVVTDINNSYIANVAKITGAPKAKTAGVELLTPLDTLVVDKQPLYIIHAETEEELQNAIHYAQSHDIVTIGFNSP